MKEVFTFLLITVISISGFSQKSLSFALSGGPAWFNPTSFSDLGVPSSDGQEVNYDNTWAFNTALEVQYLVEDYFQLEFGVSVNSLKYDYTLNHIYNSTRDSFVRNAEATATEQVLLIPMGASFVFPLKRHQLSLGAKVYYSTTVGLDQKGYYHSKGTKFVNSDSSYTYDNTFIDNEIGVVASSPRFQFGYHLGYQFQAFDKISFMLRTEFYHGAMAEMRFNQAAVKFGVVYQLFNYDKLREQEENENL